MGCSSSNAAAVKPAAPTKKAEAVPETTVKRIIITGAPASGKGTQCERIVEKYGVVHISTGDLLRAAVKAGSELGKQANEFMTTGKLVPDELVIDLVKEKLSTAEVKEKGWLLDGFPRTEAQAKAIESAGIRPTHVILLDVPDSILTDRAVGRRLDPTTGKIYHITSNPPPEGEIAARVIQRDDDVEEKVVKRLEQYHSNLAALSEAYKNLLVKVNGNKAPNDVFADVDRILSGGAAERSLTTDAAPASLLCVVIKVASQELITKTAANSVWGEEIVIKGLGPEDDDAMFELKDSSNALLGSGDVRLVGCEKKKRATVNLKKGDAAVGVLEVDIEVQIQGEGDAAKISVIFFVDKFTKA